MNKYIFKPTTTFNRKYQKLVNKAFEKLSFEEKSHIYTLDGKPIKRSVSSLISLLYEPFDSKSISVAYAKKHGFDVADVRSSWKGENEASLIQGSNIHQFAEDYARYKFGRIGKRIKPRNKKELAVIQFYENLPPNYEIVELEQIMYNLDKSSYLYSGTPDIILRDKNTDKFLIFDWKTNKELFGFTYGKYLKPPFNNLEETNFNKYQLQLSFYQILLENAGFEVSHRVIIWLKDDKEKDKLYTLHSGKNYTKELRLWLQTVK